MVENLLERFPVLSAVVFLVDLVDGWIGVGIAGVLFSVLLSLTATLFADPWDPPDILKCGLDESVVSTHEESTISSMIQTYLRTDGVDFARLPPRHSQAVTVDGVDIERRPRP